MDFQEKYASLQGNPAEMRAFCCEMEEKLNSGDYSEEDCCILKRRIRIVKDYLRNESKDDKLI